MGESWCGVYEEPQVSLPNFSLNLKPFKTKKFTWQKKYSTYFSLKS